MPELKLSYLLTLGCLAAFIYVFHRKHTIKSYLLYVLYLFPLMNLRVTTEDYGNLSVFDVTSFYTALFLLPVWIKHKSKSGLYTQLFLIFIYLGLIGALVSEFPSSSFIALARIVSISIFAYFLFKECSAEPDFHLKVVKAIQWSFVIGLIFIALQLIIGLEFTFYSKLGFNTLNKNTNLIRYPGFFGDAQFQGQYIVMLSFVCLYLASLSKKPIYSTSLMLFFLSIVAIFLAGGRAAFGGFCLGLLFIFLTAGGKFRKYILMFVGCILLYVAYAPENGISSRASELNEDYQFRYKMWERALNISSNHPFLGIGAGNYKRYSAKYLHDQYIQVDDEISYYDHPESGYLKILVEYGYLGFVIFLLFLIRPIYHGLIARLKGRVDQRICFLIAAIISWLIAFYTVDTLSDYRILITIVSLIVLIVTVPQTKRVYERI